MMLTLGVTEVWDGADASSRFFAIDTVVVRVLGVALVACALWLPLRHDGAFVASMWLLGVSLLENLVTYRFEAYPLAVTATELFFLAILLGVPAFILRDLRTVFRADAPPPPD